MASGGGELRKRDLWQIILDAHQSIILAFVGIWLLMVHHSKICQE